MPERFERVLTIKRNEDTVTRVVNCLDCGGELDGGPMTTGDVRTCRNPDCRATWRMRERGLAS